MPWVSPVSFEFFNVVLAVLCALLLVTVEQTCVSSKLDKQRLRYRILTMITGCLEIGFLIILYFHYQASTNLGLVMTCRILTWIMAIMSTIMAYLFVTTSVQSLFQARNAQGQIPKWYQNCWNVMFVIHGFIVSICYIVSLFLTKNLFFIEIYEIFLNGMLICSSFFIIFSIYDTRNEIGLLIGKKERMIRKYRKTEKKLMKQNENGEMFDINIDDLRTRRNSLSIVLTDHEAAEYVDNNECNEKKDNDIDKNRKISFENEMSSKLEIKPHSSTNLDLLMQHELNSNDNHNNNNNNNKKNVGSSRVNNLAGISEAVANDLANDLANDSSPNESRDGSPDGRNNMETGQDAIASSSISRATAKQLLSEPNGVSMIERTLTDHGPTREQTAQIDKERKQRRIRVNIIKESEILKDLKHGKRKLDALTACLAFICMFELLTLFLSLGRSDEWSNSIYQTPFINNFSFFRHFIYSFGFLSTLIFWTYVPVCYCVAFEYSESSNHLNEHIIYFLIFPCCFNVMTKLFGQCKKERKKDDNGNDMNGSMKQNENEMNKEFNKMEEKISYKETVIELSPKTKATSMKKNEKLKLKNHATFDTETPHMHSFDAEAKADESIEKKGKSKSQSLEMKDENLDDLAIIAQTRNQLNKDKHVINMVVSKNKMEKHRSKGDKNKKGKSVSNGDASGDERLFGKKIRGIGDIESLDEIEDIANVNLQEIIERNRVGSHTLDDKINLDENMVDENFDDLNKKSEKEGYDKFDVNKILHIDAERDKHERDYRRNKKFNNARKLTDIEKIHIKQVANNQTIQDQRYNITNYETKEQVIGLHPRRGTFGQESLKLAKTDTMQTFDSTGTGTGTRDVQNTPPLTMSANNSLKQGSLINGLMDQQMMPSLTNFDEEDDDSDSVNSKNVIGKGGTQDKKKESIEKQVNRLNVPRENGDASISSLLIDIGSDEEDDDNKENGKASQASQASRVSRPSLGLDVSEIVNQIVLETNFSESTEDDIKKDNDMINQQKQRKKLGQKHNKKGKKMGNGWDKLVYRVISQEKEESKQDSDANKIQLVIYEWDHVICTMPERYPNASEEYIEEIENEQAELLFGGKERIDYLRNHLNGLLNGLKKRVIFVVCKHQVTRVLYTMLDKANLIDIFNARLSKQLRKDKKRKIANIVGSNHRLLKECENKLYLLVLRFIHYFSMMSHENILWIGHNKALIDHLNELNVCNTYYVEQQGITNKDCQYIEQAFFKDEIIMPPTNE